ALRLWSRVNGEVRQNSTTADMIFSVAQIIHHLSQYMVLEPGDLINTGTPQGVALSGRFPYLREGDSMEVGIEGLGEQRQRLVASLREDRGFLRGPRGAARHQRRDDVHRTGRVDHARRRPSGHA